MTVHRDASLPGIELVTHRRPSELTIYCTDFALIVPDDWSGVVLYRRRCHELSPGVVACVGPGEVLATSRVHRSGTLRVLVIGSESSRTPSSPGVARLEPTITRISAALTQRLNDTLRLMEAPGPSNGLATLMDQLLVSTGKELSRACMEAPERRELDEEGCGMVRRMRQSLVREVSGEESAPDLTTLFRRSGLSRFQALRLFRRHYGITPYAYQLHFRIAHAKRSLRGGAPLAQVAANYGFVDQSHFTRHFKRLVGVTPGQYARSR